MTNITIPNDVAEHLIKASGVLTARAARLEQLHTIYTDEDPAPDWEWQISMDHSEAEQLTADLRNIAQFAEWLSKFVGGRNDG
jgi:hypothetical protein